ncbi:hypothetical protein NP493_578g00015 [Ridgeia piscesae]|uniref:Secreted protein n=1 Tax=Ridgeia piscesae TaxID=27915 RepID=A0AAD9KU80_RIDPI|nr:hypothetical protein NP493_578g00015 [Ridgeia piscesae]
MSGGGTPAEPPGEFVLFAQLLCVASRLACRCVADGKYRPPGGAVGSASVRNRGGGGTFWLMYSANRSRSSCAAMCSRNIIWSRMKSCSRSRSSMKALAVATPGIESWRSICSRSISRCMSSRRSNGFQRAALCCGGRDARSRPGYGIPSNCVRSNMDTELGG